MGIARWVSKAWPGVALAAVLLLAGCGPSVLDPKGPVGEAQRSILIGAVVIMLVIVVPTIIATLAFAWWFRASNHRARYLPTWNHSGRIELLVWGVPMLTIMLLGGVAWVGSHELDPFKPLPSDKAPLEVQVVSLDWKWLFIYPAQGVASVNRLVIPAGVPVHFSLTSASVMNAFFVPQLGSMIYTMNGMSNTLWLQADRPGTFHGLSSHYSGDDFAKMHFNVDSMPEAEFQAWVEQTRGAGPALDRESYARLAVQNTVPPSTFRAVEHGFYEQVVRQEVPPGPGPVGTVMGGKK